MIKKKRIILVIVVLLVIGGGIARYLLPQYERSKCIEERKHCVRMQEMGSNIYCMPCD